MPTSPNPLNALFAAAALPEPFQQSGIPFWEDEHISAQMLAAHLDPNFEGASRKPAFMDASCAFIARQMPPQTYPRLLDLGCGPGLYAQRLAALGYAVTGVDLSPRSIAYAQKQAAANGLEIDYRVQNYLRLDVPVPYDAAILVYCDYAVLSPQARAQVLANAFAALRPGGRLLLDVFTTALLERLEEKRWWQAYPKGGFWSAEPHLALFDNRRYPRRVTLELTVLLTESGLRTYYLWTQYYTLQALAAEATAAGFKVLAHYADVAGAPWDEKSETLALLLEKPA